MSVFPIGITCKVPIACNSSTYGLFLGKVGIWIQVTSGVPKEKVVPAFHHQLKQQILEWVSIFPAIGIEISLIDREDAPMSQMFCQNHQ